MKAEKAYLKGEIYCIHPIHPAKLLWFLKNPEKMTKGKSNTKAVPFASLGERDKFPASMPRDIPAKLHKKMIR